MDGPIIQTDVESRLMSLSDRLDEEVTRFSQVSIERAKAEAEYKRRYYSALVAQPAKETVARREAVAHLNAKEEFSTWKITEAQEKATQQVLIALRSQMEAMRTVAANVRAMGG